jgi:hypothetical protein
LRLDSAVFWLANGCGQIAHSRKKLLECLAVD